MREGAKRQVLWQRITVTSPFLYKSIPVLALRGMPYRAASNRLQSFNLYLPDVAEHRELLGTAEVFFPQQIMQAEIPRVQVHVHGGAWRDPHLSAASVEATVAQTFGHTELNGGSGIRVIASLNYSLSRFPTHPDDPYDPEVNNHSDLAREVVHPLHIGDVRQGLATLRGYGLSNGSYVLTSHSCGACISFQAILQDPSQYGLGEVSDVPTPAAMVGVNGLYDLPALVHDLGSKQEHLASDYQSILSNAFGTDEKLWAAVSPARIAPQAMARGLREGKIPALIWLDQSLDDQLVPLNQFERFRDNLKEVPGLAVLQGKRAHGYHALPWEAGKILYESVQDVLVALKS